METADRQVEAGSVHEAAVDRLAADLLEMAPIQSQPLLDLTTAATRLTPLPSTRPQPSPLAREQARRSPYVPTLFHAQVELSGLERGIVALLDGAHTHDEVVAALMKMLRAGQVSSATADDVTVEQVEERLVGDVEMALRLLGRRAHSSRRGTTPGDTDFVILRDRRSGLSAARGRRASWRSAPGSHRAD